MQRGGEPLKALWIIGGILLLLVLLLWLLFSNRKRKSTRGEKHETH